MRNELVETSPSSDVEVLFEPFPKQEEFINAALSGDYNFILYGGAIRGGKTISLLGLFILLCRFFPGSRWAIVRENLPVIKSNLYPSWDRIKPKNYIKSDPTDHNQNTVTFINGSQIIFFPESYAQDKEQNRWRGLEVNGFGFEEINECQEVSLGKAFERAGSYVIKGLKVQPKPLVVATCNPTQGWVKTKVYDRWKDGTLPKSWLYIQSRIYDNEPLMKAAPDYLPSLKDNLSFYEFQVFVEGDWEVQLKTGNEWLHAFEIAKHVLYTKYTEGVPVFISIDSNVHPYIAVTCWQLIRKGMGWIIRQIHELPATDPENTASGAGKKIVDWLKYVGTRDTVHLFGDYSMKSSNNIDDAKRSFFQIIEETIRKAGYRTEDHLTPHVPVAALGDFINAIFNNEIKHLEFEIGEQCKKSVGDYIESKKDKDGTILKVIVPKTPKVPAHQKNGHLLDTLKDMVVQSFKDEYNRYLNGAKTGLKGKLGYFR